MIYFLAHRLEVYGDFLLTQLKGETLASEKLTDC